MPVNCNIAPQIKVGDTFEDSKLFMELWDRAKQLYPNDPINARNKAKSDYAIVRTPQFLRRYGNWVLYHKLQNNTATNADLATFRSLYGSNMERLSKSITIELNSQNEPVLQSYEVDNREMKSVALVPDDYMFATAGEYAYTNDVFASLFIRNKSVLLKNVKNGDEKTIRDRFISLLTLVASADKNSISNITSYKVKYNTLLAKIKTEKRNPNNAEKQLLDFYKNAYNNITSLINELKNGDPRGIWASFVHYYKAEFGGIIRDDAVSDYEDMLEQATIFNDEEVYAGDELTKNWDSSKQFKEDRKKTVSIVFKKFLLEMIYNSGSITYDFGAELEAKGSSDFDIHNTKMDNFESKYGLKRPVDINMLWNQLIVLTADITDVSEIANKIKSLSDSVYNGALQPLIDRLTKLEGDPTNTDINKHNKKVDRFFNTYCNSIRMAMTPVAKSVVTSYNTEEGHATSYRVELANRECYGRHNIYNSYRTAMSTIARSNPKLLDEISKDFIDPRNDNSRTYAERVIDFSNKLTLFIDPSAIANYIATKNHLDYNDVYRELFIDSNSSNNNTDVLDDVRSIYNLIINIANVAKTNDVFTSSLSSLMNKAEAEGSNDKIEAADDLKNYLNKLSIIGSFQPGYKINLMFTNAKGETEYTPEFFNSLSNRIQGIVNDVGEVKTKVAEERFKDLLTSINLKDNPVLWNMNGSGGLFNPRTINGVIQRYDNGVPILGEVNIEAFRKFRFERFCGISNADTGIGIDYVGMHGLVWTNDLFIRQMQGLFSMPSGDASRCYQFSMASLSKFKEAVNNSEVNSLPFRMYSIQNKIFINPYNYLVEGTTSINDPKNQPLKSLADDISNSKIFKMFRAGIMQEIENMRYVLSILYNINENGTLSIKDHLLLPDGSLDYATLRGLPSPIFWDGTNLLDSKGLPTGRIFKFLNYTYRKVQGNKVTTVGFLDYINDKDIRTLFKNIYDLDENNNNLKSNIIETLVEQDSYKEAFIRFFVDIINARVQQGREDLDAIRKSITSTETYKNQVSYMTSTNSNMALDEDSLWDITLANQFMLYSIYSIAYQDMFVGSTYEFKDATDWAKRVSQAYRIGAVTLSKGTYKQIVVKDAFVTSNMLGLLKAGVFTNGDKLSDEDAAKLVERYGNKDIESTNAFNVITEQEALRRFKEKGDYDRYNPDGSMTPDNETLNTINKLINGEPTVTKEEYMAVVQQLKYYYFDRTNNYGDNSPIKGFASSHQDKNSTIVLFKHMYAGTEYEKLANWMEQEGIDSINFVSAHKVGNKPVLEIFKKDADTSKTVLNIIRTSDGRYQLGDGTIKASDYIHTLKYSSLYTQQTIPSHLKDETNKIGTQLEKKIFDNFDFNGEYINPSDKVSKLIGKTNSNVWTDTDDSSGLFNRYHMMLAAKASDNEYSLLKEWGAIDKNGNLKVKPGTNLIEIDVKRMMRDIRDYFNDTSTSQNIIEAVRVINGRSFLPLWHPTIKSKIESVLLARIDKRINRLKIKGAHCTIQPDNLIVPSRTPDAAFGKQDLIAGDSKVIEELINNQTVFFSKEFWASRCEVDENGNPIMVNGSYVMKKVPMYDAEGNVVTNKGVIVNTDASFELRSEYYDENGVFHPAEMILNSWDSRLPIDEHGHLDLNAIPDDLKTMFGIRIPTEGMQSMFVVKVVGVINNGASQAILPRHLMERTGHDFDIDSIYLYMRDFEVIEKNGKKEYVTYEVEGKNAKRQAIDYLTRLYFEDELNAINEAYYSKRDAIHAKLEPLYDKLYANKAKSREYMAFKRKISELKTAKANMENELFNADPSKAAAIREEYFKITNALQEAQAKLKEVHKFNKDVANEITEYDAQIEEISKEFDVIAKERDAAIKELKNTKVLNKYNSLDVYHRSAMQAKDNYIIDTWISIHTDPKTFMNREKPNTYEHSVDMSNYTNAVGGYDSSTFNQHFMLDALKIRNNINDISVLKGIAISASQTMGVMAQTGMRFRDDLAIPIRINVSEFGIEGNITSQSLSTIKYKLSSMGFNDSDIHISGSDIVIMCKTPFNNPAGTWTDQNDNYISEQATELPAHILDAAKYFMGYNINTTTALTLSLLTALPITHNVNLEFNDKVVKGANKFAFGNLLIHQQIIVDFVNELAVNQLNNKYTYSNVAFANVREYYTYDLIYALAYKYNTPESTKKLADIINEFNTKEDGSKRYTEKELKMLLDVNSLMAKGEKIDLNSLRKAYKNRDSYYTHRQVDVALRFITYLKNSDKNIYYNYYDDTIAKAPSIKTLDNNLKAGINYSKNINNLDNYITYLSDQLTVLDYYMAIDKTVQALRLAQATLTAEKKGSGPNMTVSDKFLDSIIKLHLNFDDIITEAKRKGVSEQLINEGIKDYYSENSVISKSKVLSKYIDAFNAEIDEINSHRNADDQETHITILPPAIVVGNNESAMEAVYPFLFDNNKDVIDSVYPLMAQQLKSVNILATRVFSDIFITEDPIFKANVNYALYKLGKPNDPILREKFINYAINSSSAKLPFFRCNDDINDFRINKDRISKLVGAIPIYYVQEDNTIKAKFFGLNPGDDKAFSEYANMPMQSIVKLRYEFSSRSHEERVALYKSLPLAVQVSILKASLGSNLTNDFDHILNLLDPSTNTKQMLRKGYIGIPLSRYSDIESRTIDTLLEMINSPDDFIRSTGEDLVRYAFYIYGMYYGKNFARYIFNGLLGYSNITINGEVHTSTALKTKWGKDFANIDFTQIDGTTDVEMRNTIYAGKDGSYEFRDFATSMAQYAAGLYNRDNNALLSPFTSVIDQLIENFVKANADSSKVVRRMSTKRTTSSDASTKNQEIKFLNCNLNEVAKTVAYLKGYSINTADAWSSFNSKYPDQAKAIETVLSKYDMNSSKNLSAKKHLTGEQVLNQLIVVPRAWIESSEFAKETYLVSKAKLLNDPGITVPKIVSNNFKTEGKLYKAVFKESLVYYAPINRTLPTEYGDTVVPVYEFGIEDFNLYSALIDEIDKVITSFEKADVNNVTHNSVSLTIQDVTSNADETLYIGSDGGFNATFIEGDSTTKATISDVLGLDMENGNPFRKIEKLALIGGNEALSIEERINISERFTNILNSFLERHKVQQVDVVQNGDVSDAIIDALRANKRVKVNVHTVKEPIHKSVALSTFDDGADNGNRITAMETLATINQLEKTAIANMSIVSSQLEIMGIQDKDIIKAIAKEKEMQALMPKDFTGIDKLNEVLDYNIENLNLIAKRLSNIAIHTEPSYIGALFEEGKDIDRNVFLTDLNIIDTLIASQAYINDLALFDESEFANDTKKQTAIKTINEKILTLKNIYTVISDYKDKVDNATTLYFATLLIKYSHNPAINSEFNNLRRQLAEKGFDTDTIEALQVNPTVLAETIKVMLKDNLDLSFFAKMLDSVRQMGVPVVDTTLKSFENIVIKSNDYAIKHHDNLFDIFKKYYGSEIDSTLPKDISRSRAADFRLKFIDDNTHQFINPFDYYTNDKVLRSKTAEIHDTYISKIKKFNEELIDIEKRRQERYDETSKLVGIRNALIIERDKLVDAIAIETDPKKKDDLTKQKETKDKEIEKAKQDVFDSQDIGNKIYAEKLAKLAEIEKAKTDRNNEVGKIERSLFTTMAITSIPIKTEQIKGRETLVIDFDSIDYDTMLNSTSLKEYNITKAELMYMLRTLDRCMRSTIKTTALQMNHIDPLIYDPTGRFIQANFNLPAAVTTDEEGYNHQNVARTDKFRKIAGDSSNIENNKDLNFLLNLQDEIFNATNDAIFSINRSTTFFPIFIKGSIKGQLQSLIGYKAIEEDDYKNTVTGDVQYYLKAQSMNKPRAYNIIGLKYGEINEADTYDALIEKARDTAKRVGYETPINNLSDVVKLNSFIYEARETLLEKGMNFDPINALRNYVAQLAVVKTREDFRPTLQRLETLLASSSFEARNSGRNYLHRGIKKNTGETEIVTKKGKETEIYKRYKSFFDTFEGKGKINSKLDQILRIFTTTNSRTLMWMNITAAIKNIGTGNVNIWSEAVGGEFITAESILKAQTRYFAALMPLMSALGEYRIDANDTDYTQAQLDAALIKLGGNIFEEGRELNKADVDVVTGILAKWDNIAYMPNSVGEHYLQFTTYLAAMDTHRVVHGKIMNYEQFIYYLREKVLKSVLTADELKAYEELKDSVEAKQGNNSQFIDHIDEFLTNRKYNISRETKRKFANLYTKERKDAKKIFESKYATVKSQFVLKNGLATIKDDSDLNITEFAGFLNKVRNVNNSLHGIYNSFDQSELSQRVYGEMMLQFRKWLRPSFIRYFGRRTGKVIFDEGLEAYRSGAYLDAVNFVLHNAFKGWSRAIAEGRETNQKELTTYIKAVGNFLKGLVLFAQDMGLRYRTMPEFQRMNIRRAMGNAMSLALLTLAAGLIMEADWDDKDEDEALQVFLAVVANTIYGVQTELLETGFTGMYLFYKRTSEAPIPFETTLTSAIQVLYWGIFGNIFLDSDDLIVSSGVYKGQNKVWVNLRKIIPGARSFYRLIELPDNSAYYLKTNPMLQIVSKLTND